MSLWHPRKIPSPDDIWAYTLREIHERIGMQTVLNVRTTATAETNSTTFTTLDTLTLTNRVSLRGVFRLIATLKGRNRNTNTTSRDGYFRIRIIDSSPTPIEVAISSTKTITAPAAMTADAILSWDEVPSIRQVTGLTYPLKAELQARASVSAVYVSFQPHPESIKLFEG